AQAVAVRTISAQARGARMRLVDLDPKWLLVDGRRVGFVFRSPTRRDWWQSCFAEATPIGEQLDLFEAQLGDAMVQPCKPSFVWTIVDGIAAADFATITVDPSLDGSPGGLWHGHVKRGEIVGGLLS